MKYNSVTDIIGPVMVGPSSSHTAGAVRIGQVARSIYGGQAEEADLTFYGSFAHTFKGHGTDVAVVAGLLGLSTFDICIPEAFALAKAAGLKVTIKASDELTDHPNTAKIVMRGPAGEVTVTGISIGGGSVQITEVNDFQIRVSDDKPTTLIIHQDKAGVIASVTEVFGRHNVNIAHMEVARKERGELALMSIETDEKVDEEILSTLRKLPYMYKVIHIKR
ncbi:MAG: L-serine ammonia-lyase, iron-sulfur-dependent subunit beta [Eubacteriales bacterium]|nr:L-serine ammonia-lyase, iron-sulfur-dependent subunit beta [Eubacteriales bacterium]